jgi:hypothetical protein
MFKQSNRNPDHVPFFDFYDIPPLPAPSSVNLSSSSLFEQHLFFVRFQLHHPTILLYLAIN